MTYSLRVTSYKPVLCFVILCHACSIFCNIFSLGGRLIVIIVGENEEKEREGCNYSYIDMGVCVLTPSGVFLCCMYVREQNSVGVVPSFVLHLALSEPFVFDEPLLAPLQCILLSIVVAFVCS